MNFEQASIIYEIRTLPQIVPSNYEEFVYIWTYQIQEFQDNYVKVKLTSESAYMFEIFPKNEFYSIKGSSIYTTTLETLLLFYRKLIAQEIDRNMEKINNLIETTEKFSEQLILWNTFVVSRALEIEKMR